MVAAVEMVREKAGKTPYPWQERRGYQAYQKALAKGAVLRPLGNVLYFMPPLTTPAEVLGELLDIAFSVIDEVTSS
jgi:adenosylmethionine-8-amino-7-oxononanoate aminotransferase